MTTIYEIKPTADDIQNTAFNYQPGLTSKLDELDEPFDQANQ